MDACIDGKAVGIAYKVIIVIIYEEKTLPIGG